MVKYLSENEEEFFMTKSHRKLAREKAVFAIYQWLLTNATKEELHLYLITCKALREDENAINYSRLAIDTIMEQYASYRLEVSHYLKEGWTFSRLGYLEQAILLVACFEIKNQELDKKIIANEAVELAKRYGTDQSPAFVNAILAKLA